MSIIVRLFFLVLVALTPVTAIQVVDEIDRRRTREVDLNAEALRLATLVGMEEDRIIEGGRQLLTTLAQLHSIRTGDRTMCARLFSRLATTFPFYAYVAATDAAGNTTCSTSAEIAAAPPPEWSLSRTAF